MAEDVNQADVQYQALLKRILSHGEYEWNYRTKSGIISGISEQIRIDQRESLPILTSRRIPPRMAAGEILFFARGESDLKTLRDQGHKNLWEKNVFNYYLYKNGLLEEIPKHSEKWWKGLQNFIEEVDNGKKPEKDRSLGRPYGPQWREWTNKDGEKFDQLADFIHVLKEGDFSSRSNRVQVYNPGEVKEMSLKPCVTHFGSRVVEKEDGTKYYDHNVGSRSGDLGTGVAFNIFQHGLMQRMVADEVGMVPRYYVHTIENAHLYTGIAHPKGLESRTNFLRKESNLEWLNKAVSSCRDAKDFEKVKQDYLKKAPKEPEGLEGYDHIPLAIEQLKRTPSESPNLEFKVDREESFWNKIQMHPRDLFKVTNYNHQGDLTYELDGKTIKPEMAD